MHAIIYVISICFIERFSLLYNTVSNIPVVLENKFFSMLKLALCVHVVFINLPHRPASIFFLDILHVNKKLHQHSSTRYEVVQNGRVEHRMKTNARKIY